MKKNGIILISIQHLTSRGYQLLIVIKQQFPDYRQGIHQVAFFDDCTRLGNY